jgi:hypothetical protein
MVEIQRFQPMSEFIPNLSDHLQASVGSLIVQPDAKTDFDLGRKCGKRRHPAE